MGQKEIPRRGERRGSGGRVQMVRGGRFSPCCPPSSLLRGSHNRTFSGFGEKGAWVGPPQISRGIFCAALATPPEPAAQDFRAVPSPPALCLHRIADCQAPRLRRNIGDLRPAAFAHLRRQFCQIAWIALATDGGCRRLTRAVRMLWAVLPEAAGGASRQSVSLFAVPSRLPCGPQAVFGFVLWWP